MTPWSWLRNEATWSWWRQADRQLMGGCLASGGLVFVLTAVPLTIGQQEHVVAFFIAVSQYTWYKFARSQGKQIPRDRDRPSDPPPNGTH